MNRSPVFLLAYALVLGPGAVLASAPSLTLTDDLNPVSPERIADPYNTGDIQAPAHQQRGGDGQAGLRQDGVSFRDPVCRHGIAGGEPDKISGGKACIGVSGTLQRFSVQLGRRVGVRSDILGEFDGVRLDYRVADKVRLNGIAGYPVVTTEDEFNTNRQVFGLSLATDRFAHNWDMNGYLVEQQENGEVAGRSMGGAIRRVQPGRSLLAYLDYDVVDNTPGTLILSGAWKFPRNITLSTTLDFNTRPLPQRQQLYLQQSMAITPGWDWILPTEHLTDYTGDDSVEVGVLAIGLSQVLSQQIKLSGDVVVLDVSGVPDGGITAQSSEYFYHVNFAGKDLLIPGVYNKLDLRHSVTGAGHTNTAIFDTRYAINRFWDLVPQLRADYHSASPEYGSRWEASPKVKMVYRQNKQFSLRLEAGGRLSDGKDSAEEESRSSYFVSLGYQANF